MWTGRIRGKRGSMKMGRYLQVMSAKQSNGNLMTFHSFAALHRYVWIDIQ